MHCADPQRRTQERHEGPWLGLVRDLGDCLSMTFAVDIAFRSQRTSQLVYQFPSPNALDGILAGHEGQFRADDPPTQARPIQGKA